MKAHRFLVLCAAIIPLFSTYAEEEAFSDLERRSALLDEENEVLNEPLFVITEDATPAPIATPVAAPIITKAPAPQIMTPDKSIQISLKEVFSGSPIIYTLMFSMSVLAFSIWLYNFITLRQTASLNENLIKILRDRLMSNQYDEALGMCLQGNTLICKMLAAGISTRKHGLSLMVESMKAEGKRASAAFWQRTALLNDIAIIAPMLGLLGTVLGMFYAFYDLNRSLESITTLFDGLGISIGTTVAGLIVAILALIFQSSTKYRLVKALSQVENEATSLTNLLGN